MATVEQRMTDQELQEAEKQLISCYGAQTPDANDFMSRTLGRALAEIRQLKRENLGLSMSLARRAPAPNLL